VLHSNADTFLQLMLFGVRDVTASKHCCSRTELHGGWPEPRVRWENLQEHTGRVEKSQKRSRSVAALLLLTCGRVWMRRASKLLDFCYGGCVRAWLWSGLLQCRLQRKHWCLVHS